MKSQIEMKGINREKGMGEGRSVKKSSLWRTDLFYKTELIHKYQPRTKVQSIFHIKKSEAAAFAPIHGLRNILFFFDKCWTISWYCK